MPPLFKIDATYFGEVKVISPTETFSDERGFFSVSYRKDEFDELGLPTKFVQDNLSRSIKGVVRGLHFQLWPPMGKLMRVTRGSAFLVAVDIRRESPTFLQYVGVTATEENQIQVWAPAEFARGFCSMSDITEVQYKCTGMYNKNWDMAILWNDPRIGIKWPIYNPIVSKRDQEAPTAAEYFKLNA